MTREDVRLNYGDVLTERVYHKLVDDYVSQTDTKDQTLGVGEIGHDHAFEKPCNFIVFTRTINGIKYYYALYGSGADQAGKIAYGGPNNIGGVSGTDASTVIQAAINGGDKWVHIKGGTYFIKTAITLPDEGHLKLTGDGPGLTVLKVPVGYDNNIFEFTGVKTANSFFNEFRDFQLYGNRGTGGVDNSGFLLNSTDYGVVDSLFANVFIESFKKDGIFLSEYSSWANVFFRCTFEHCEGSLITCLGGADRKFIGNKFLYCHGACAIVEQGSYSSYAGNFFYKNDMRAIHVGAGAYHNVFMDNIFTGNSALYTGVYDDIYVESGKKNIFEGNSFAGGTYSAIRFPYSASEDNLVMGNLFFGTFGSAPIVDSGTRTTIRYNKGYVTENSGTATIASGTSSIQVAHGLAGTPNVVVLGATHSEVADAVWSADATNITITVPSNVTADRKISWYAEYKP